MLAAKAEAAKKVDESLVAAGISAEELAKKEKQQPKIDAVISKVEDKKTKASELFKLGQYGEAVKIYKQADDVLMNCVEDFPLFRQELAQVQATIYNNMAACSKKDLDTKSEILYTTKVIDLQEHLTDSSLLLKAYLRRGIAYENSEKFLQAREDMLTVREIQYDNKVMQACLTRVNKAIKQEYGDKVPEVKKNKPIKMATGATPRSSNATPPSKLEPTETKKDEVLEKVLENANDKKSAQPAAAPEKKKKIAIEEDESDDEDKNLTTEQLEKRLNEIKTAGNEHFKTKSFVEAVAKFSEAISIYQKNEKYCYVSKEVTTLITQCYTNRALGWSKLDNHKRVIEDANYVLNKLDEKNAKALFRRAVAYKATGQVDLAIKDYEIVVKTAPTKEALTDLNELKKKQLAKMQEQRTFKTAAGKGPLIEEINDDEPTISDDKKADSSDDEKEKENKQPKKAPAKRVMHQMSEEVNKLREAIASQKLEVPTNATALERDFLQLKKNGTDKVHEYFAEIPPATVEKIFKRSEIEADVFTGILEAFAKHGLTDGAACTKTADFLMALSRSPNFETAFMFIWDEERAFIDKIAKSLGKHNADLGKKFKTAYDK